MGKGTIHERAGVIRHSIENHLEHETNHYKYFVLSICFDLLFSVDYTQASSLLYSRHLRRQYETIAKWAQSKEIPDEMASEFESIRHSLARVIPLKPEEIAKYGTYGQPRSDDQAALNHHDV
jgi:hypothetical protein